MREKLEAALDWLRSFLESLMGAPAYDEAAFQRQIRDLAVRHPEGDALVEEQKTMKTRSCTQCGARVLSGDRFCTACGAEIKSGGRQRQGKTARRAASRSRSKRSSRKSRRRPTLGVLALGGGVLLFLVALLLFLDQGRSEPVATPLPDAHDEQGIPYPEVARIDREEAKARYDAGTALFVDVRSPGEYETAHILDAVSLPLADFVAGYQTLPREAEIITYCT